HRDGTLANYNTSNPAWATDIAQAIDLGASSIFSGDLAALKLDGSGYVSLPNDLIRTFQTAETIEAWFQTESGGVILGYENSDPSANPASYIPALYVGTDGRLYGGFDGFDRIVSNGVLNDGSWHHVALVINGSGQGQTLSLYLDDQLVRSTQGSVQDFV